jgi:hypothetical protein
MEPEGSLPHLQEPATCPCPEPDPFWPYLPTHFTKINLNIIFLVYAWFFEVALFPRVSAPKHSMHFSLTHVCYMPCSSQSY